MVWLLALWVGALVWMAPACSLAAEYSTGPASAWAIQVTPGLRLAYPINAGRNGFDSVANVAIPFDPSHEALTLHANNTVRIGQLISKLAAARIQVLQRGTELDSRIYDGARTIKVFLHHALAGDNVRYPYSLIGHHPKFRGFDFCTIELQHVAPVARIHGPLLLMTRVPVTGRFSTDMARVVRASVGLAISSVFLLPSQRVRSTFVVRDRPLVLPPLPSASARGESDPMGTLEVANDFG